jgi:Ulp1 family protease
MNSCSALEHSEWAGAGVCNAAPMSPPVLGSVPRLGRQRTPPLAICAPNYLDGPASLQLKHDIADVEALLTQEELTREPPRPRLVHKRCTSACSGRSRHKPASHAATLARVQTKLTGAELRLRGQTETIKILDTEIAAKNEAMAAMQQSLHVRDLLSIASHCTQLRQHPERHPHLSVQIACSPECLQAAYAARLQTWSKSAECFCCRHCWLQHE